MPIASFGNKIFQVSRNKINTFSNFSWNVSLDTEEQEKEGNKSSTYVKGYKLDTIDFDVILDKRFCNVKKEIYDWRELCNKRTPYHFVLGKGPIIGNKFILLSVDIKDSVITSTGEFQKATLGLKFQEYVREGHKEEKEKKSSKDSSTKEGNIEKIKKVQANLDDLDKKRDNPAANDAFNFGPLKGLTGLGG